MMHLCFVQLVLLLFSAAVQAKDLCSVYRNYTPLPEWYNQMCNAQGTIKAKTGGAFSSLADSFNLNPASIPTYPTPYGFEYISSFPQKTGKLNRTNFGFIKGFQRFGAGLSTNADDTFYSNSTIQIMQGTQYESVLDQYLAQNDLSSSLNIGSALALVPSNSPGYFKPNIGGTFKYNKLTGNWNPGFGVTANSANFTAGFSRVVEMVGTGAYATSEAYYTMTAGFKANWLQIEYVYMTRFSDTYYATALKTQIWTGTLSYAGLLVAAAFRRQDSSDFTTRTRFHTSVQYQVASWLGFGYLYNYLPGYHSVGAQFLF